MVLSMWVIGKMVNNMVRAQSVILMDKKRRESGERDEYPIGAMVVKRKYDDYFTNKYF